MFDLTSTPTTVGLEVVKFQAIRHTEGPVLIIAVPGSRKARTLVERIAQLVQHGIPPEQIMVTTFTQKAAKEMKKTLLVKLLQDEKMAKAWFTGMLTQWQSDLIIHYLDPHSHTVRSYYPDFLLHFSDGSYVIMEVKGDNIVDDAAVKVKAEYAVQLAGASSMRYRMLKGTEVMGGRE